MSIKTCLQLFVYLFHSLTPCSQFCSCFDNFFFIKYSNFQIFGIIQVKFSKFCSLTPNRNFLTQNGKILKNFMRLYKFLTLNDVHSKCFVHKTTFYVKKVYQFGFNSSIFFQKKCSLISNSRKFRKFPLILTRFSTNGSAMFTLSSGYSSKKDNSCLHCFERET